jgi:SAM-dependent methyltransferase
MHPEPRLKTLREALYCPSCKGKLNTINNKKLKCASCNQDYPIVQGKPILMTLDSQKSLDLHLDTEDGLAMINEYADKQVTKSTAKDNSSWWIQALKPPQLMLNYRPDLLKPPTNVLFKDVNSKELPFVLNVGGGPVRESEHEITLNVRPFHNVDIVADAHNIPLPDNSVDAIFSLAVLEHVADPQKVVSEMYRVLKPGGYLYSEIPFIFFFHGYPTDFTRFTQEGIRNLFCHLDDLDIGMVQGPMSALLQSSNMVWLMFIPERWKIVRKVFNGLFRWIFFPLKYLDLILAKNSQAHTLAGGFYALGRKPHKD